MREVQLFSAMYTSVYKWWQKCIITNHILFQNLLFIYINICLYFWTFTSLISFSAFNSDFRIYVSCDFEILSRSSSSLAIFPTKAMISLYILDSELRRKIGEEKYFQSV